VNAKAGICLPLGNLLKGETLGSRKLPPSCPKISRKFRFEERRAAREPKTTVQGEQEDVTSSENVGKLKKNITQ